MHLKSILKIINFKGTVTNFLKTCLLSKQSCIHCLKLIAFNVKNHHKESCNFNRFILLNGLKM